MKEILLAVTLLILGFLVYAIFGALPLMLLWNWLMPYLFGLPGIDFGQAFGLLVLSGLLFKSSSSSSKK